MRPGLHASRVSTAVAFVVSTALAADGQVPNPPGLPDGWGPIAESPAARQGCPVLEGLYLRAGEMVLRETKEGRTTVERGPTGAPIWSGHPRLRGPAARKSAPAGPEDTARTENFWIVGNPPQSFEVRWLGRDKTRVEATTMDPAAKDFVCTDGAVVLAANDSDGYRTSEGVSTAAKSQVAIMKMKDGAIVYVFALHVSARSFLLDLGTKDRVTYYRFAEAPR